MRARGAVVVLAAMAAAAFAAAAGPVSAALAAPKPGKRIEYPIRSKAPDAKRVAESLVRIYAPLPDSAGPHPRKCDWVDYLRFRDPDGPRRGARADAVIVAMPGFLAGASGFDQIARHTVEQASRHGSSIEVWALDRRANCLEDNRGVRAAAKAKDPYVGVGYYYDGAKVNGRAFRGFKTSADVPFLDGFGMRRTLEDEYTILTREIPNRRVRARKLICGGHSLGGPLTAAFAAWDFDGDPTTTNDAGYKQCAGFYGLDTSLTISDSEEGVPGLGDTLSLFLAASSEERFFSVNPVTPATVQIIALIGLEAFLRPDAETQFNHRLPDDPDVQQATRFLFSRDAANFASGDPGVDDFHMTGEVLLGGVFDDNSDPISILRSSVGVYDGGAVADKNFPAPNVPAVLAGQNSLMIPSEPGGPLYRWRDYDQLDDAGAPEQIDGTGQPYTTSASEVSDIHQLARVMFESRADFIEQYFPTRIVTDVVAAIGGDRSGDLAHILYDGVPLPNSLLIQAGDGIGPVTGNTGAEQAVVLPGYDHLDVVTAAAKQNSGAPEGASTALRKLALEATGSG